MLLLLGTAALSQRKDPLLLEGLWMVSRICQVGLPIPQRGLEGAEETRLYKDMMTTEHVRKHVCAIHSWAWRYVLTYHVSGKETHTHIYNTTFENTSRAFLRETGAEPKLDILFFCTSCCFWSGWFHVLFLFARWVMTEKDSDGFLLGKHFFFFYSHEIRLSSSHETPEQERLLDGFWQQLHDADGFFYQWMVRGFPGA